MDWIQRTQRVISERRAKKKVLKRSLCTHKMGVKRTTSATILF